MIEVTAAIVEQKGKVLAARRKPGNSLAGLWELPGGKVEAGETHPVCLRRELIEELSIRCDIGQHVFTNEHCYGDKQVRLHAYAARITEGEPRLHDHDRLCWLEPDQLMELNWAPADIPIIEHYLSLCRQRSCLDYYQLNAKNYALETQGALMTELYALFEAELPSGARILDLGCGSGRDSRFFKNKGYRVMAVDACEAMTEQASEYIGCPVTRLMAQELNVKQCYEGIWCSASLLHCRQQELASVFHRIARALVPGGICFASFKLGDGERVDERGRFFCDQNTESLTNILVEEKELQIIRLWEEQTPLRGELQGWCSVLVTRV
ncbi:NUDIX domain-containing protein [Aestuariirhabdus sp. Z084]|uniref:NUDIX domain-containing protein n=1 Tax=Aestuariirhabdus haliotis TaxID=2918751 RepID=UPI00201B3BB3|nr:NUDIX domain-containing protein [Aestuariirhabdus haliotis]MCL6417020.1 NUDIX domain-containing protein [Aestuariirhabdus haliotis]MCL6421053.1 NUDIX domain-containing protein [Aestuariirhabdus haliotis]